jgi:amino acid permease
MSKKTIKKISTLSGIIFVLGATIGAGIFVKNGSILNNVGGSL